MPANYSHVFRKTSHFGCMQAIARAFGGHVVRSADIMHGKTSVVSHKKGQLYQHIPETFQAARYHSLTVERQTLPSVLRIEAETQSKDIMGIRHNTHPTFGVQFHPESILSEAGTTLLKNFLAISTLSQLLNQKLSPHQAQMFLRTCHLRGETADEIHQAACHMQRLMRPLTLNTPVLDIVGTGGDGANTINISTGSAILAASMGVSVLKHGNRAVSSKAGAADVLEALGVPIHLSTQAIRRVVQQTGFGFCYAPNFHPTFKAFKALRQNLEIPTLFNLIGPLLNPARASYIMLGVAKLQHLECMAEVLMRQGITRGMVFHTEGLDELCPVGLNHIIEINQNTYQRYTFDPRDAGLLRTNIASLKGRDAQHNASVLMACLKGEPGPIADTLILNAGAAHYLYGRSSTLHEGIVAAKKAHLKGLGYQQLQRIKQHTYEVQDA